MPSQQLPGTTALVTSANRSFAIAKQGAHVVVAARRRPQVTAESVAALAVLGIVGTGFACVLNYQIITSDGARIDSDLPAARDRDRARSPGS